MECRNCHAELKDHQTFYCSRPCRNEFRAKHRDSDKAYKKLLQGGYGAAFDSSGNSA